MKQIYTVPMKSVYLYLCTVCMMLCVVNPVVAQPATVAIPVAIGRPCGAGASQDSVKYFNYSATTNTLTHRSLCKPSLAAPGFSSSLATITYNSYDGYLYFMQIAASGSIYNTSTYRWLPTGCPTGSQAVYKTFTNQFVAGVEFDPSTGLGYQLNFVDTTGWAPSPIDVTGTIGQYASHAVVNGNPAVAYYDATNKRLKYIRSDENNGSSWTGAPVVVSATGDVGKYASLFVVNGNPAIAYYDGLAANLNLMYVRANDVNGTSWGTPVVVESTGDVGQFASLNVVNGNPAIAYYDNTNGDLRYVRANDANGTAWGTPLAVETTNNIGQYASLKVVNGNPAIAFYDVTNGDLRYRRATDANGTAWAAGIAVESTNNIGQYASLLVVNGNPAISYYDVSNGDLRYDRATDANGTAWGTPVNISSTGTVGQYTCMQVVNGNPGIAYYDATNKDLKFVRANDASGTAWGTPLSVETTNDVGQFASLTITNGNPSIAYFDNTNFDLRYVRAYDASGTLWFRNSQVYNMELQQVNFTSGSLGNSYPLNFGGRHIYKQNGDIVMTPSQQLLAIFDNKYFTVNWQSYGTATPLVATYIDTMMLGTGNNLVGLAYSDGKLVGAISPSSGCYTYKQIDILTGAQSAVTYNAGSTVFGSADMTDITSGIGAAKKLVSLTENPVGSGTYDVVYDVFIKNYGGTPVTNVQAYDTLYKINGLTNLVSGSIVSVTGPAGFVANPSFNGKTVFTLFNTPLATLSNIPGQNTVTVRVTAKVSNILKGVVYYNQAFVTGNGLFGDALKDASTDGSNPDLNNNSKPDDATESQPTPFLISVAAITPPCATLTNILYTQNFGSGSTGLSTTIPAPTLGTGVSLPVGTSLYTGSVLAPLAEEAYVVTNNANLANTTKYVNLTDHTGGPINPGRFLVVNADANANILYKGGFTYSLCANQQYSLSFYAAFLGNSTYQTQCDALGGFVYSKIKMNIRDGVTGLIITQVSTSDITTTSWQQYGLKFVSPASYTSIIIELVNDQVGGCGNVLGIDDVQFGSCDALPVVNSNVSYGCIGSSVTFSSSLTDPTALPGSKDYQWQVASSASGPWTNIGGATSANYTIVSTSVSDTGKYYRVIVAATGNIGSPGCQYTSPALYLPGVMPSTAPSGVSASAATLCASGSATLTATGGTLGTGANYQWGTGSVVGTNPILGATSSTYVATPGSTTTYWVQIQNTNAACAAANGGATTVITVNAPSTAPSSVTGADVCSGGSTTLTAVGGTLGTGANYQWGTGSVVGTNPIVGATASTYTVTPGASTTYWVRIQNTSAPCTANTSGLTKLITVNAPSTAPTSATGADVCAGGSTTLTAVGGALGTGANYQWGTGSVVGTNPIVGATASTYTVTPGSTTTYWVQIQNTAAPCPATGGVTKLITVNAPSTAPSSVTGADICVGGSTTLTAVGGTLGTGANYQWGTGSVVGTNPIVGATGATYTATPGASTTYWVQIQNTTAPCTATTAGVTKLITVNAPSTAPGSVTGADICGSGSTTLTAVGGALGTGANYQWGTGSVVGTNPIVGATASTYVATLSSTTTYWVQIQNTAAPCPATGGVTKVITVNAPSTAPTSVTGLDVCAGTPTTLTALGGSLGTGANYQWGTGSVVGTNPIVGATNATLTVTPLSTTTYWVQIQNGTAPCAATTSGVTKTITVSQLSVAATGATKNKNNICAGISVNLGITGGTLGTSASWKWYTGSPGGTLVGTGATISVTPSVTTTYYVRAEGSCNTTAAQSVTVFISCNIDKDQDGIPDWVESNMSAAFADANSNGIINAYDPTYPGFVDNNNDFINDNFQADGDSDNDGIPNYLDTDFPGRVDSNGDGVDDRFDNDLDGVINMLDLDSDNDGIPDVVEAGGVDTNGDGKIDNFTDTDNDGLSQNVDGNNTGAYNTGLGLGKKDTDGDGVPNYLDLDSDNDGIPDVREVLGPDANNDGKADGFVDANGDGLNDNFVNGTALLKTGADTNGDGKADSYPNKNLDQDPYPNAYDLDSDGDGIVDVIEAGLPDANFDGKVDGALGTNGWSTTVSSMATLTLRNTDGVGNPDYLDIDSDDDGIPDNIEGQPTAGYKLPGTTDTDGDGLVNTYDNIVGFGGSGIFVWDQDGDGIPDYRDLDTDGDGQPDIVEGNDFNLNGRADDLVTLTGLDTDGDGLDNRFDSLNSTTNLKGTSYMMGNSGSLTGDPTPGSRCTVQKKTPMQTDRDWRFTSSVLPVQFLGFTANAQSLNVLLNWTIITPNDVDHFEVERSTDNSTYTKIGTVSDKVKLNEAQSFHYLDDISSVNAEVIYYRLKVVAPTGEIKYSNVLVVRRTINKTAVSLMPNPASDYLNVKFFAEKESTVTIRIVDNLGKLVLVTKQGVLKGNNTLQITGLTKYSAGVYIVQIFVNDEVVTQKLIIGKQ